MVDVEEAVLVGHPGLAIVTGAFGYTGGYVARRLIGEGVRVRTLSRERLMSRVWSTRETDDSTMVRGYVRRLRLKLGETADNPRYIFNEPRVGYR